MLAVLWMFLPLLRRSNRSCSHWLECVLKPALLGVPVRAFSSGLSGDMDRGAFSSLWLSRAYLACRVEMVCRIFGTRDGLKCLEPWVADVYVVSAVRTPLGAFNGLLKNVPATELGSIAIRAAVERANISPSAVQEVYMGNVVSAGLGQAPARQASLGAGLPLSADCTTINKVCSSGLKAVMIGALSIGAGTA